ncbi:hypothetical protein JB92DRAFT_2963384, partial [Gautieria morchelliformis]
MECVSCAAPAALHPCLSWRGPREWDWWSVFYAWFLVVPWQRAASFFVIACRFIDRCILPRIPFRPGRLVTRCL